MREAIEKTKPGECWSQQCWNEIERETCRLALDAATDEAAWDIIIKRARTVLRTYSTSFFIVTRFLPPVKRAKVEAIYAAVRYPDEIVDTFPIEKEEQLRRLDQSVEQTHRPKRPRHTAQGERPHRRKAEGAACEQILALAARLPHPYVAVGRWATNLSLKSRRTAATNLTHSFSAIDHEVSYRYLQLLSEVEGVARFGGIIAPVEIVYGEKTFGAIKQSARLWQGIWPHARCSELRGAGHLPILEATEQLSEIVFAPESKESELD